PIVARTEERLQVLRQKKEDEVRVVWLKAFDGKAQDTRLGLKDVKQRELALPNGVAKILAEKDERVFEPMFMKVAPPTPAQAAVEALLREARALVKFWAVPVRDGKETEEKVNLAQHRWQPGESFYLHYEAAVPVQLGVFDDEPGKADRMLLPDVAYPASLNTALPGEPGRLPVPIKVGDRPEDEVLTLVGVQAGGRADILPSGEKDQGR